MTGQPIPVIIDCDTGVDDALALLFAVRHPGIDLRAVTCVAGNTDVDGVVRNTLTVLEQAGAGDVPVARGAERPLIEPVRTAQHVHGLDGMGDLGLPAPTRVAVDVDAVTLLRREILASPTPVTLVPTAPLTNIALLLRTHPDVVRNIERIVFMGGAVATGNATPVAEFNVWHDPEAAAVLLTAGVPITMYGLDVFERVVVPAADVQRLRASAEPALRMAGELLAHRDPATSGDPTPSGGLGDAGAVCAVVDPGGLTTELLPVEVSLTPGPTRGQTVVDRRRRPGESEIHEGGREVTLVDVGLDVDVERYVKLWLTAVEGA
ncbi:pyrimidine-specific ribonucleoside hydrolase [Streptomyces sp. SAI-208]|uniref:nucleoside hydrolase n=1 Tax=unclassified Streptomyces TaxID=2593676 RepID=UPI002476411E|nr:MULTISPECIES: nucleoside hydrolase [unclassified Streptomyces]MDH6517753.1 pyrimidine-specific ribonucleoside hydrolase [Streptomyces sp. SAI-090]MDH6549977.1 pyrimidine-specific ribonucleoside hydrolase [Streptomyces sp. SAI-041]MDH6569028.1 pyrimidine-specific ribonucleoside hydrolase [Streptomyces sp. SAI-117]MDH6586019.1 pyrimidine-specific ribonucleoside hydrolase [Streptomyces sp. SAI-133]MDH6608611.1 pyrimidine-specific ribonucleoside hydrolase [Streptomyces sp. SAI-208]